MATEATASELAQILGQIKEEVVIGDKTLVITPFKTKQFVDVLKCIDKLADAGVVEITDDLGEVVKDFDPLKVALRGGDQLIRILHIASDLSIEHIEGLDLVEAVKLTSAVFKVNLDFFFQNGPAFKEALGPVWETLRGVGGGRTIGQQHSTDSSPAGTE